MKSLQESFEAFIEKAATEPMIPLKEYSERRQEKLFETVLNLLPLRRGRYKMCRKNAPIFEFYSKSLEFLIFYMCILFCSCFEAYRCL